MSFEQRLKDAMAVIQKIPTDYDAMNKGTVRFCGNRFEFPAETFYSDREDEELDTYKLLNFVQGIRQAIAYSLPEVTEDSIEEYIEKKEQEIDDIDHSGRGSGCCQSEYCKKRKIEGAEWLLDYE